MKKIKKPSEKEEGDRPKSHKPPPDPLTPLDEQMEKDATGTPEIHFTKEQFGE